MLLVALATLLGAGVQSATGFGFALILGPAIFAAMDPAPALTTLLILAAMLNVLILFSERRPRQVRGADLRGLLITAAPGMLAGAAILAVVSKPLLQVLVGATIVVAVALRLRPAPAAPRPPAPGLRALTGLGAGALTTTTGTNGPPMLLWLQRAGATPAEVRDTLAAAFLTLSISGAAIVALSSGEGYAVEASVILPLAALVPAGQLIGRLVFERLDPVLFRRVGLGLALAAGLASVVAGAA